MTSVELLPCARQSAVQSVLRKCSVRMLSIVVAVLLASPRCHLIHGSAYWYY